MGINCHAFASEDESGLMVDRFGAQVEELYSCYRIYLPDCYNVPFFDMPKGHPTEEKVLAQIVLARKAEKAGNWTQMTGCIRGAYTLLNRGFDPNCNCDPRYIDPFEL